MSRKDVKPPRLAMFILKCICRKAYYDEVIGDLLEVFEWRRVEKGPLRARLGFFVDTMSAIRLMKFSSRLITVFSKSMLLSFFKSSLRNMKRHWSYTALNVFGLAVAMMAALFILEYVSYESNFNRSDKSDRIYRVSNDYYRFGKMVYESSMTFSGVGPAMQKDLPEVINQTRMYNAEIGWGGAMILTLIENPEVNAHEKNLYFTDPAITGFFDLELLHGTNRLSEPNTMLMSFELAEKYFGTALNALGKTIRSDDDLTTFQLEITGIYHKPDFNLQIDMDGLISYVTKAQTDPERFVNNWGGNSYVTFVEVAEDVVPGEIEKKMADLTLKYKPEYLEKDDEGNYNRINNYYLTAIQDIHLYSDYQNEIGPKGDALTVRLLQAIALLIVGIAWINFINLTTAKSIDRAKEVGVRKVMGAKRPELIFQFFTEAVLLNTMALAFSIILVILIQPAFNEFVELPLSLRGVDLEMFGLSIALLFFFGTTFSALYPASVLASHPVVLALKKGLKSGRGIFIRRGLITFQLLFSFLLVIATLTIKSQLDFMTDQNLGFKPDQVLIVKGPTIRHADRGSRYRKLELFKSEVGAIPVVGRVGSSGLIPGIGILRGVVITTDLDSPNMFSIERMVVDEQFLSTLGMDFIAGNDFLSSPGVENPIILNESAIKLLGFSSAQEAVGRTVFEFGQEKRIVVGVIADYHHESLKISRDPMYFIRNPRVNTFLAIELSTANLSEDIEAIEKLYVRHFPGNPMESFFLSDFFERQYAKSQLGGRVFTVFAVVAILIACLGLYGLSTFTANQRTKEIGVRKVLGAKPSNLFFLLSKEVFVLVLIGFLLAVPVSYYGMNRWLANFAYPMDIKPSLFLLPLALIILITILAIGKEIVRVSVLNPVKSLRHE